MLKEKAIQFTNNIQGKIVEYINGHLGAISVKVEKDSKYYYVFSIREWYRKYNGVTIPKSILQSAINDNAMIVLFVNNEEYWKHSSEWKNGKSLHNSMFDKDEVLVKRNELNSPNTNFPTGIDSFF